MSALPIPRFWWEVETARGATATTAPRADHIANDRVSVDRDQFKPIQGRLQPPGVDHYVDFFLAASTLA
jgi:hypothetical protein